MTKIFLTFIVAIIAFCQAFPVLAKDKDVVLSALIDEMDRSMKELRIDAHPTPYFISYSVKQIDDCQFSSCLGSHSVFDHHRERILTPVVRVGNYDLDSSYPVIRRPDDSYVLPIDDNYAAIRRDVWLDTDIEYKDAITKYQWKKEYLNAHSFENRLPDMSHEPPVVALGPTATNSCDEKKWSQEIEQLAALFKNYPKLQKSKVTFIARTVNRWFVNSEGSRIRDYRRVYGVRIWAETQADDGMSLEDSELVANPDQSKLPEFDELKKTTENLAQRLTDLRMAPKGADYCGPVLFEDAAAADLFSRVMARNFSLAEEYIGSESWSNPLKNRVGRKVLSKELTLIDDPAATDEQGNPLIGAYQYDDEGVPGRKVTLVENGLLKGFCQSRIPTRHCDHSNGHSVGGHGVYNVLKLSSSKTSTPEEIKSRLTDVAREAGLDYVLVISRLEQDFQLPEYPSASYLSFRPYDTPSQSIQPRNPLVVYKLHLPDGKRELVRGLEFAYVSIRSFRDVLATGNDAKPYIIEPNDDITRALITPSYVIGELELTPVKPAHNKPPLVPNPLVTTEAAAN
jgi:hypothetical protein